MTKKDGEGKEGGIMNKTWNEIKDEFMGRDASVSDADKEADVRLRQRISNSNAIKDRLAQLNQDIMSAQWKRDSLTGRMEEVKADMMQRTQEIDCNVWEGQFVGCLEEAEERLVIVSASVRTISMQLSFINHNWKHSINSMHVLL